MSTVITPFQGIDSFSMATFNNRISQINTGFSYISNPNLLDNWYFGNPVDQRGGYVVPPGKNYYDGGGGIVGTLSTYTTVSEVNTSSTNDFNKIVLNEATYFVLKEDCVRGYTGAGYGIDRWKLINATSTLLITNEGVKLIYGNPNWHLSQYFQDVLRKGITYTYSVLYKASGNNIRIVCSWGDNKFFYNNLSPVTDEWSLATVTGTIPEDAVIDYEQIVIQSLGSGAGTIDINAAKLELGSQQTLAHQDADGNWQLNELPNYGEQLARCQRYARWMDGCYSGYIDNVNNIQLSVPEIKDMRTLPTISNIQWDRFVAIPYGDGGAFNVSSDYETAITYNGLRIGNTGLNISRYLPVATVFDFRAFLSADV